MASVPDSNPLFVQSFAKGLEILRAFNEQRLTMNLPEMAAATGMTKSAAQRFAFTLEALGYLAKDESSKRYELTPRVLELGYRYLLIDRFVERANPYLLELCGKCGESVSISRPSDTDMVYVGRFPSHKGTPVYMPVGRRLPMYCTSAGRAYLSAVPEEHARRILTQTRRHRYTPTTVTDVDQLMKIIREARDNGYSFADGEYYRGDLTIAGVVHDASGLPVGAVNIAAPTSRWTLPRLIAELSPLLLETCRKISTKSPESTEVEPFRLGRAEMPTDGELPA